MKRIFPYIALVTTLFSCVNDLPDFSSNDEFNIEFGELSTRALVNSNDEILAFGVFTDKNTGDAGTSGASTFTDYLFTNEKVWREDKNSDWDYVNKQYWVYNRVYHFFAYYPYVQSGKENGVSAPVRTTINSNDDVYQIPFETPSNAATDLLTAYRKVETGILSNTMSPVQFDFAHALSKINLSVAKNILNTNNKVVVTSVSLIGVKNTGNYNCNRHSNRAEWSVGGTVSNFSRNNLNKEISTSITTVLNEGNEFLLIPQSLTDNTIKIQIKYSFYHEDGTYAYSNTVEVPIPSATINKWEASKSYVYKMTLSAEQNDILFLTPGINLWDGPEPTNSSVIIQ